MTREADLPPAAARVLAACAALPWISAARAAMWAGLPAAQGEDICAALAGQGWIEAVTLRLTRFPARVWAVTGSGLGAAARALGIPPRLAAARLGLSAERFWAMRAAVTLTAEVNAMCAASADAGQGWETLIERRWRKRPLFLHGRVVARGRPVWVLNDRGEGAVTRWSACLRYLSRMARRAVGQGQPFPPLLMVTTVPFRAWALLTLARLAGAAEAGAQETPDQQTPLLTLADLPDSRLIALATSARRTAIERGLPAVAEAGGWMALTRDNRLIGVNPFEGRMAGQMSPRRARRITPARADGDRLARLTGRTAMPAALPPRPPALEGLERLEALDETALRALGLVCRAPLCPSDLVEAMLGLSAGQSEAALETLRGGGLIEPAQAEARGMALPALWVARERGFLLWAARELRDGAREWKRYAFFAADHARRPGHTLTAYRFFADLKRRLAQRAAASRPGADGRPHYEWLAFESESAAAHLYAGANGRPRLFRPDGYGALRAGEAVTRFWVEIDGWLNERGEIGERSRAGREAWQGKVARLCDYYQSMWWTMRYPVFPRLLIVTTDPRRLPLIRDALIGHARGRGIPVPAALVADARDVRDKGATGRVWRRADTIGAEGDEPQFAFDALEQPGIARGERATARHDLIGDLQRGVEIGLLAMPRSLKRTSRRQRT